MMKVYRSYSYVVFGAEKVGKTNIITRFTKDEFTENHNLTLEGQQTISLTLDGRVFEVNLYDTAGQEKMVSLKAVWRNNKDGFIFTFAINNPESFQDVVSQIRELKQKSLYSHVTMVLLGNKIDLEHERKVQRRTAQAEANALGIKYFELSAKTSPKQEIDSIIYELIEINEMERFQVTTPDQGSFPHWFRCDSHPCSMM